MSNGIAIEARRDAFVPGIEALRGMPSSVIGDVMGRLVGTTGLHPVNRTPVTMCGNALTVSVRAGDNLLIHKALELLLPGDALVVDGAGDISRALVGEIMMTVARMRGSVGFVMDGAVRDVQAFEQHQFPCWARGINLRGPYKDGPGTINRPISIGGMLVNPGDIIVGDSDGLVAVSPQEALAVAKRARKKVAQELATIQSILNGSYSASWIDERLKQKEV
ncbi:RraA family protein [Polaromonas jejuensis]|uniref:Putative 4-hydroxy-4-methyl-2-oxoglutarate aldolase n=1 Tax=Polaromonas jejuensis TaxID=457502 RepID=A0ABW0QHC5_9BURK|nr:RraA family protein [Polaromonas jejuensis]